jgi:ceramide glucosyltransferase
MFDLSLLLIALTTLWVVGGYVAVTHYTRSGRRPRRRAAPGELPPISVLKPLRGADPGLEENLESFFRQDHPAFELVFGVEDPADPAIPVVRALIARYPRVPAQLVVHRARRAGNPKIANLLGILPKARHDWVLISDSNIRAPRDYLRDLAHTAAEPGVGLVSNLFAGTGERSLGAALESTQLNGFIAAGTATPMAMRDPVVVGKSMFMRKSVLARLGGLESVADVLAEDWVLGKMFQHAGYRIRLGRVVLENVTGEMSAKATFDRHLRWSVLRSRLSPLAFVLEPAASPVLMLPFAMIALPTGVALLWAAALLSLRDVGQWLLLRGPRRLWIPLALSPIRDLSMLLVWLKTPFTRHLAWRGHPVRVGPGTRVFLPEEALEPESATAR